MCISHQLGLVIGLSPLSKVLDLSTLIWFWLKVYLHNHFWLQVDLPIAGICCRLSSPSYCLLQAYLHQIWLVVVLSPLSWILLQAYLPSAGFCCRLYFPQLGFLQVYLPSVGFCCRLYFPQLGFVVGLSPPSLVLLQALFPLAVVVGLSPLDMVGCRFISLNYFWLQVYPP